VHWVNASVQNASFRPDASIFVFSLKNKIGTRKKVTRKKMFHDSFGFFLLFFFFLKKQVLLCLVVGNGGFR